MNYSTSKWLPKLICIAVAGAGAGPGWAQCPGTPPAPVSVTTGTHATPPIGPNLIAQTFTAPGSGCLQLDSIKVRVQKANSDPSISLSLRLYQTSGGLPDLANPIGAAVDLGTTTSATFVDKIANFNPKPQLQGGMLYAFVLSAPGATGSTGYNAESRQVAASSPYTGGVLYTSAAATPSTFTAQGNRDLVMEIVFSCCDVPDQGCTYSHGFWMNHSEAWPVASLDLGSSSYDQAQLLSILKQPSQGNGLVILAHQLVAAKLNIANGADDTAVAATITASDALIGANVVPPVGSASVPPSTVEGLSQTLDQYNNGAIGPGHCQD
jgi:hypothetical protein